MNLDTLETRTPDNREKDLFGRLPAQLSLASKTPYYQKALSGIDLSTVRDRAALGELPITRKSDLMYLQSVSPPFGGLNVHALSSMKRVFQSPGPIHEMQGWQEDNYRMSRAMRAAGFERGDLVHNTFSYHFTPGAWIMESGAHALGCCVFPAGTGQTEMQAQTIAHLKPRAYTGTPSFLKIILEKAQELNLRCDSLTHALVSGEALTPSLRTWFGSQGIRVCSAYATADVGLIAYETQALEGAMVVDEGIILEIVEPLGSKPLAVGEVGEVVVTVFDPHYPLVRFATGDLSAIDPASLDTPSPCGRTNMRILGWMGRADQTTKVKGMFIHPAQLQKISKAHPGIIKSRIVVSGTIGAEVMTLQCEVESMQPQLLSALEAALIKEVREVTKLRANILFTPPGTLPNDGRSIEDARSYG